MKRLTPFFLENMGTKILALVITLFLWFLVLGRRDFVLTKDIDFELKTNVEYSIMNQSADKIRVRVSGPRLSLKKFKEENHYLILNLQNFSEGLHDIDIPNQKIELPSGVKILSVRPNRIRVEIQKNR